MLPSLSRLGAALTAASLLLSACGGGSDHETPSATVATPTGAAQAAASPIASDRKAPLADDGAAFTRHEAITLFDYAQYNYPSLFVDSNSLVQLEYLGTTYLVRSYPNGNHLGLTLDGRVFGLGPFTGDALTGFGRYSDYVAGMERDRCGFRPQWCTPPTLATAPTSIAVPATKPMSFSVTAAGTGPFRYQWMRNGVELAGATEATLNLGKARYADDLARFSVRVSNAYGSTTSTEATVTVTSPLIGRSWAGAQSLEENTSAVSVRDRRTAIDDEGNVTVLFRKSNGTREVLYAMRGTPGAGGAAPSWSEPAPIDVAGSGAVDVAQNWPNEVNYAAIATPSGHVIAYWLAWQRCTASAYSTVTTQSCWYLYMNRFRPGAGWQSPTLVDSVLIGGGNLGSISAAANDRGDVVFQVPGWVRSGTSSHTAARTFLLKTADEAQFRRQPFQSAGFGDYRWAMDGAGNLLIGASLTQNATTDVVAYRGTVAGGFDFGNPRVLDTRGSPATLIAMVMGLNGHAAVLWTQNNGVTDKLFAATQVSVAAPFVVGETPAPATGRFLWPIVTDEGQVILYYMNGGSKLTWSADRGWSALQQIAGFPGQNVDWGFDTGYYYSVNRSGDILGVNTDNGAVVTYDAYGHRLVMQSPASAGSPPPFVLGYSAASLGIGRTHLLAANGTAFVSLLNRYDTLPTPAAPAGDGRSVTNLWGAFMR